MQSNFRKHSAQVVLKVMFQAESLIELGLRGESGIGPRKRVRLGDLRRDTTEGMIAKMRVSNPPAQHSCLQRKASLFAIDVATRDEITDARAAVANSSVTCVLSRTWRIALQLVDVARAPLGSNDLLNRNICIHIYHEYEPALPARASLYVRELPPPLPRAHPAL